MNKRKTIIGVIFIVIILTVTIRIVYVNVTCEKINTKEYLLGEKVEFENNFNHTSNEDNNGYSITVLSSKIYKYKDYVNEFNLKDDDKDNEETVNDWIPNYVYDVVVKIENKNNEEGSIDFLDTFLYSNNLRMGRNQKLFKKLYPQIGSSFSFMLHKNTQMEMHIPYTLENDDDQKIYNYSKLCKMDSYLSITLYPIKKIIKVT